jgi:methylated-DNA-protein-cysteine methyltransferase-like protein
MSGRSKTPTDPSATEARYQRIWRVIAAIPPGQVASYGQVAELAGIARGARQVARALRYAPAQLDLPWFRVLRADGRIAMAPDSSGVRRQRKRLTAEGVLVNAGRVNMRTYRWAPSSDEILLRF